MLQLWSIVLYVFFSGSCRDTYGLPDLNYIRIGEQETRAFCTSEFSDISPLTGGSVPFSTLEGRPSAKYYDSKSEFWVRQFTLPNIFINHIKVKCCLALIFIW
jgi:hypothetical protein